MARLDVITLTNGAFAQNCYILVDRDARDAVIVDPGEEADLFLRRIATERVTLKAVWLTHSHADHILGVAHVVETTGVPLYLHPDDRPLYDALPQQSAWLGLTPNVPPPPDQVLAHGIRLSLGGLTFEVRHVPGHSPGHVAFVGHGVAVVGDALFAGSIGRTDLPGGDAETLLTSIREQLLTLPDGTIVYPGHGPATTIGAERRGNPFLTGAARIVG
ncbi:MAG TPA: MBL fold metallo-hydrolase [Gemmatimonadales bacterium]|nr:MBL fold metallo-hydrolase [Gemmatimonadales bacterium]